ncbi:MAG: four helix bundle protein [Balneolaceae bacterium]|nr:four helix bundle protein [Balneolaceae bacterium]
MLNLNHKKLNVWIKSIELVKEIYEITDKLPTDEKYGLISQTRRASISVASNISEGASRKSKTERSRFYEIARSSLVELDTQIELCLILRYLDNEDIRTLAIKSNEVFAMLSAMK